MSHGYIMHVDETFLQFFFLHQQICLCVYIYIYIYIYIYFFFFFFLIKHMVNLFHGNESSKWPQSKKTNAIWITERANEICVRRLEY